MSDYIVQVKLLNYKVSCRGIVGVSTQNRTCNNERISYGKCDLFSAEEALSCESGA